MPASALSEHGQRAAARYRDAIFAAMTAYLYRDEGTGFKREEDKVSDSNLSFVLAVRKKLGIKTRDRDR
jgi:hypothetical protein